MSQTTTIVPSQLREDKSNIVHFMKLAVKLSFPPFAPKFCVGKERGERRDCSRNPVFPEKRERAFLVSRQ